MYEDMTMDCDHGRNDGRNARVDLDTSEGSLIITHVQNTEQDWKKYTTELSALVIIVTATLLIWMQFGKIPDRKRCVHRRSNTSTI